MESQPFWKQKSLHQLSREEWELLCDGCAKCCLFKLEDKKTGSVSYTGVCCRLLSLRTCRCTSYKNREKQVPTCMNLSPTRVEQFHWLPKTCAYRLVHEGKDLPLWHHLVSGDKELIHRLGFSIKGKVVSEKNIHMLRLHQHVVDWE